MRHHALLAASLAALGCSSPPMTTPMDMAMPPTPLAKRSFSPPAPWAKPIEDYLAVARMFFNDGEYDAAIHDLAVFEDRLYLGYGDGTRNLGGFIPIDIRSFASPDSTATVTELVSDEEQIDRFRILDGELWQAGVDATDTDELAVRPLIVGNVYRRPPGAGWTKYRTVPGGEHVQDVSFFEGAFYAVGSGAANRTEFEGGMIFRYLWRSNDRGATWEVVDRQVNMTGDTRWVQLLPMKDGLYAFGYVGNAMGFLAAPRNVRLAGGKVEALAAGHPLARMYLFQADPLPDGSAIIRGFNPAISPPKHAAWRMAPDGTVTAMAQFATRTLVDIAVHPATSEVLFLTLDGAEAGMTRMSYPVAISVAPLADLAAETELARFTSPVAPASVVAWRDAIYYGTGLGEIWRAAPK